MRLSVAILTEGIVNILDHQEGLRAPASSLPVRTKIEFHRGGLLSE